MEEKGKIGFDYIRENNLLLYEYIRGSHLYGLSTPTSDIDRGGIYIEPIESLYGLGEVWFPEFIADKTNDTTWNSLKKFFRLLNSGNPNQIESLWAEGDKVLYCHPAFELIKEHRDKFLTKRSINSLIGYSKTQLAKAKKLKSRIVNPVFGPKMSILEFVYYPFEQGSRKITEWLKESNLSQRYCGLTNIPHMKGSFGLYYDWKAFWLDKLGEERATTMNFKQFKNLVLSNIEEPFTKVFIQEMRKRDLYLNSIDGLTSDIEKAYSIYFDTEETFKYHGIMTTSEKEESNQLRFSSIPKGEISIMNVSYNKDDYAKYCQQFKEYNDWNKHHNKERFDLATKSQFDRKNACHCARLLHMGIEIMSGEGLNIDRTGIDRDFLLTIRRGELSYEDLLDHLKDKEVIINEAIKNTNLPDELDLEFLNELMISVRKKFY